MSQLSPTSRKNRRVAFLATGVVIGMIGLSYAAVPFYKAFCKATGFGGTTQRAEKAPDKATDKFISVRFDANTSNDLGWEFHARKTEMQVKIGEQTMAYYDARNTSTRTVTGSAIFNVSPPSAGAYFNKIQCFCFTKHTLQPGQAAEFPVMFFVDPALLDNPDAAGIKEITLSYTFYPAVPDTTAAAQTN
ncbi:MAG: cytochrome c oxidase assembly protein [Alphaproteobacteria bacterium]|nr:cytochrome c oxidase assembly protein [Alphaproteobacteria bacterium]